MQTHISIWSWLYSTYQLPLTPPANDDDDVSQLTPRKRKRKRVMSNAPSSDRSESPKRRRTANDVPLAYSLSGSETPLTLNHTNTFSASASRASSQPKRTKSPARETPIILRNASPPILTEGLNGLQEAPPDHIERLADRLAEGIDSCFIPQALEEVIKSDIEVGHQTTRPADFDPSDARSIEELSSIWKKVKQIFLNARDCKDGSRDENAWCDDVVRPLLCLAIMLSGNNKWWFQSVQSQSINPLYLSTIPAPTLTDPTHRKLIDRKSDYVLSYSHRDPTISGLCKRLDAMDKGEVGHTYDAFTRRTALFSGFEVKSSSGDKTEAELQVNIWIAAQLRKKRELAEKAQFCIDLTMMVEPAFTIVGHDHSVYYAYPRDDAISGQRSTHVLGPDIDRFGRLSTESVRGVFRLLRLYGNLLRYGMDEGEDGYWGCFLGVLLDRLAKTCE